MQQLFYHTTIILGRNNVMHPFMKQKRVNTSVTTSYNSQQCMRGSVFHGFFFFIKFPFFFLLNTSCGTFYSKDNLGENGQELRSLRSVNGP